MQAMFYWLMVVLRLAFGALFVFSGLNDLLHFWQPPAPVTPQTQALMQGLVGSGFILPVLGVVYLIGGLTVLFNRFAALGLVILAAPTVVIFSYHATEHHLLGPGLAVLIVHLLLAWQRRDAYVDLFQANPARRRAAQSGRISAVST
ncbi:MULTISPECIES: DoxX family membrane protein [Dyella]|nr:MULTISPECIES: DoxX family membrane protein [Dyella]